VLSLAISPISASSVASVRQWQHRPLYFQTVVNRIIVCRAIGAIGGRLPAHLPFAFRAGDIVAKIPSKPKNGRSFDPGIFLRTEGAGRALTRYKKSQLVFSQGGASDSVFYIIKGVAYVLERTIRVEADLIDQLFNSSEKRLARALLLLANFGNDSKPKKVIAKVSQETLAEMVGTTRSRVSHFMNKFRKMGFIDYNGHLEIHSSLLNVVLHDQPHISGVDSVAGKPDSKSD
jgi:hypothetical protein